MHFQLFPEITLRVETSTSSQINNKHSTRTPLYQ